MSIIGTIASLVTPKVMSQIAALIGGQQGVASKAMSAAVPTLLAALVGKLTGNKAGLDTLGTLLSQQKSAGGGSMWSMLSGGDAKKAASAGTGMVSSLLGGDLTTTLASSLRGYAGLSDTASRDVLGAAGAAVMGALGKTASDRNLDAAGLLRELQGEKDDIARAMPPDFAKQLEGTGLLDSLSDRMDLVRAPAEEYAARVAEPVRTATPPRPSPPPPPPPGRPWWHWALGLVILLGLLWWLMGLFGRDAPEEPVATTPPPATEPAPEATTEPAEPEPAAEPEPGPAEPAAEPEPPAEPAPAAEPEPAPEAEPAEPADTTAAPPPAEDTLVVDGVDIGETLNTSIASLTDALGGITDPASAQAALPGLTEISDRLGGLEGAVAGLSDAAQAQVGEIVGGALPDLQATVTGLLANQSIADVLRPVLETIVSRLSALAG